MSEVLFTNANVFDGTGSLPKPADVLVHDNRIAAVSARGDCNAVADTVVVDCKGGTLLPGLTDVHTHLALGSSVEVMGKPGNFPAEVLALTSAHCGRVMLDYGYTSAYSGGSGSGEAEVAVKQAFDKRQLPGPRLVTSSFERLPGGSPGLIFKFPDRKARPSDPQAVVEFVAEMAELGLQSVKFLLNGISAFDSGSNTVEQFYEEEIMAAGEAARAHNVWLTAHCYSAEAIKLAIKAGFRVLYHCNYADEEALDAIEAAKDTIFIGLAPGIEEADRDRAPKFGVMASDEQVAEQLDAIKHKKMVGTELRKRGVRSLPGGDYGFPWNPVGLNSRDLELFVEWFGYTPAEVLQAATQLGGVVMGQPDELGLVKEGYLADLIVVDGDPTVDIGILRDAARITHVMKDGRFHRKA